jgi:hypothetical protein
LACPLAGFGLFLPEPRVILTKIEGKDMSKEMDAAVALLATTLDKRIQGFINGQVVDPEKHQANLARRAAEYDKKRPVLDACLNPEVAAKYELEKPRYKFKVSMVPLVVPSKQPKVVGFGDGFDDEEDERPKPKPEPITLTVVAQNEDDAWARFCDSIGHWPGRRFARPTIVKGKQVSLAAVAASQSSGPYKSGHPGG